MKKTSFQSGFFNPRILIAVVLCLASAGLGWLGLASTPSTGTLSDTNTVLTYDAGPFNTANTSPVGLGQLDTGPRCDNAAFPCDNFALTVSLPAGYAVAHPNGGIKVTMFWVDTGSGKSDYDLYIYNGPNPTVDGNHPADHQSASGANPEVAVINPLTDGVSQFSIKIVPATPTQETVHVRIELLPGSGGLNPNFGGADPTTPGVPRFQNFLAPAGTSAENGSQGEFNIGFNPHSGRIMVMNSGPIWRLTPGEVQTPSKPECCEALWEDRSANTTNTGLDPILWTDQKSGRTFVSNSTAGANVVYAYSDSDGEPSVTQPTGWTEIGGSLPNGGADHETIGSGPYPLVGGLPNPLGNAANQGEAVYYCSQDIVGPASCQRSDTLGASYGPGILAYNGTTTACGGLHGHLHVAPDGTVWLPVNQCHGAQGGALSTTAGATWNEFIVTGSLSQAQGADPSIAIDSDSTAYYAYVNNEPVAAGNPPEGHPHVKVSLDHGATWIRDFDLGASHGIKNAAEIEAVGGSSGRAAVGFLGTDVNGDYQAISFPGKWYAFIATTYDGGVTWNIVNATPNDPVQSMSGVWQQGGSHTDRNLLDFNEISVDDKGRVLYGYSDGCVKPECIAGAAPNDFTAFMRVARQSGGRSIFASHDAATDTTAAIAPKPACLSGTRDPVGSHLVWKAPDNGGSDIVNYQIFRGNLTGNEQLIGQTGSAKTEFTDTAPPTDAHLFYYVKAINSAGTGLQSNEIDLVALPLPPVESACVVPGITKLVDPAGDTSVTVINLIATPAPPGSDLLSLQLAQPLQNDGIPRLVFTINTDPNPTGTEPPGSAWYVAMKIVNGATTTYTGVHMAFSNPTTPVFESYTPSGNTAGGVDGRFVTPGSQKPAEPGSNYNAALGRITIIVKASDLGLQPGDAISGFLAGVSQSSDPANVGVGATALYDSMPDSLSFANSYTVVHNNTCAVLPVGIVSRQVHGSAGPFDINLPLGGAGSECRTGGANNAYTLIYTFGTNLKFAGTATVSQGTATTASLPTVGPNLNQVTVSLTGVTNAQHLIVDLTGAQDTNGAALGSMSAHMDVLLGDTTGNGAVNSSDISQTQSESGHVVSATNFREDVTANGAINSSDISVVQSKSGTALPAAPATTAPSNAPTKRQPHQKKPPAMTDSF